MGPPAGKYARHEFERRYLCSRVPDSATDENGWDIADRYLKGSRLRLRRMDALDGSATVYKLGKKEVPAPPDFTRTTITTIYLSAAEYEQLAVLPAFELRKRRYRVEEGGRLYSVDVFGGAHEGLILAETDFAAEAEMAGTIELPDWIEREVSNDETYTGGRLAQPADR